VARGVSEPSEGSEKSEGVERRRRWSGLGISRTVCAGRGEFSARQGASEQGNKGREVKDLAEAEGDGPAPGLDGGAAIPGARIYCAAGVEAVGFADADDGEAGT